MTRPDIALAYLELSKYVKHPHTPHMDAVHRVLRYLRSTHNKSFCYSCPTRDNVDHNIVCGRVDAD